MRYWLKFVVALAAVVAAALVFGSLIAGLPALFVAGGAASAYGLLVAANILPPGRPPDPTPLEDDDLVPFDYRTTLAYPAPPFPRMPTAAAFPRDETEHFGYDPLDDAYAYYATEREAEGHQRGASPLLFAGLGVLALGVLSIGAVVARASRDSGTPGPEPSVTPALALAANTPTATSTAVPTATPTRAAPSPSPTRRIVIPTPRPSPTATATATATDTPEPTATPAPPTATATVPSRRATEPPPTAQRTEPPEPTKPPKHTPTPLPTAVPTTALPSPPPRQSASPGRSP